MNAWIDELAELLSADQAVVVVTVVTIRGSAPREPGAKMIVTENDTIGTIGGGKLEYECTRIAVAMLATEHEASKRSFPLGATMGQCCGGVVDVLFEPLNDKRASWLADLREAHLQRMPAVLVTGIGEGRGKCVVADATGAAATHSSLPAAALERARALLTSGKRAEEHAGYFFEAIVASDFNIAVFGAGHVGSEVVSVLSRLDCNIHWVDSRRNVFPAVPPNVCTVAAFQPALEVAAMPPRSAYLVMTHSHALDFDICDRILRRDDAIYCGLIGSRSKRRRFEKRFREQRMPQHLFDKLVCPIGVSGIGGKKPAEIAVATAAELLRAYERARQPVATPLSANVRPLKRR